MQSTVQVTPVELPARDDTLPATFQRTVREQGERPALHFRVGDHWTPISWNEYGSAVARFANALLSEGIQPGARVAIWAGNRPEWQIADLGTMHAGAATVAIYQTLAPSQVEYILAHSEARVLVVEQPEFLDQIEGVRDRLPALTRVILLEGEVPELAGWVVSWETALRRGHDFGRVRPGLLATRWQSVRPDDMASLIYTSGTTGTPKGAILTHRNLTWTLDSTLRYVPASPGDRVISFLPLAHILERIVSHLRQVRTGSQVYFCPSLEQIGPLLREVRPTFFVAVPRLWEKMYARIRSEMDRATGVRRRLRDFALAAGARRTEAIQGHRKLSSWGRLQWRLADRIVFSRVRERLGLDRSICGSTSAPISPEILRFFYALGIEILEIYGQTEATGPSSGNRPGQARLGTVGPAMPGVEIRIAEDGEVLVRGPNVFSGYFKDAASTAEAVEDGWLLSGDVGHLDRDGYLLITDRKKDLFKTSGGKYVAPGAIENGLKGQRGISQAVVLGDGRPYVAALITLDPDSSQTRTGADDPAVKQLVAEAIAKVNQDLSHPEQIRRWTILKGDFVIGDELTPTLKVKRKVVNEKYRAEIEALYAGR